MNTTPDTTPKFSFAEGIARIQLNRPSQHNRIDPSDLPLLREQLKHWTAQGDVVALVIEGTGGKSFSSGYTLQAIVERLAERDFEAFLDELEHFPALTIAAMHGGVYGGATDLALCCDIRLGTVGAKMFMPAARIGLHYYPQGMRRYVQRLGLAQATQLLLTACTWDEAVMLRSGFLHELLEVNELPVRLEHYLGLAKQNDAKAVAAMKQSLADMAANVVPPDIEKRFLASLQSDSLKARLAAHTR